MNKFILTLFIVWILWKVFKSVIEEIQQRLERHMGGEEKEMFSDVARRSRTLPRQPISADSSREPHTWELGQPIPGKEEDELEKWYREALERKRQLSGARPQAGERMPREPARPQPAQPRQAQPGVLHPRPTQRRVEPRVERRHEARMERRRVAQPREHVAHEPARRRREEPALTPKPPEFKRAPKRETRRGRGLAELVGAGEWDMNDIRRGIIIAEILGRPKGLTDIDSHVI